MSRTAWHTLVALVAVVALLAPTAAAASDDSSTGCLAIQDELGLAAPFGPYVAGNWPSGCWRPYGESSPFNQLLPASPRVDPQSEAIVERMVGWGSFSPLAAGTADTTSDWQHPTYWSRATDPVFTVHCTNDWGRCEIEGMEVRIPDRARAAGGNDAHLTVVDQAAGWEWDMYEVQRKPRGGGRIEIAWGGRTPIGTRDAHGLGADSTAAHFGNLAGIIRAQEMQVGEINHALFLVVDCDNGQIVYPARGNGAPCSDPTNAPAQGMRFQLAMSEAEIDALPEPDWKKTILRAMARYGMYVGDTGGSPWDLEFESGSTYTSFGYEDPMVRFAREVGIPRASDGRYYFDIASGVDWGRHLRVIDPCVTLGECR